MNADELPDFPLAPWELPPDSTEPLVAPATMRVRCSLWGRMANWLVRVVPTDNAMGELFVREEADSQPGSWWMGRFRLSSERVQEVNTRLHVFRKLRSAHQIRVHHQDSTGVVDVGENFGSVEVFGWPSPFLTARFEASWSFDLRYVRSSQVHAELLRLWHEEDSPLQFAWRWHSLSQDEQLSLLVLWKRGDANQLRHAMRLALKALGTQLSISDLEWTYSASAQMWTVRQCNQAHGNKIIESGVLMAWEYAFIQMFGPSWNDELREKHGCAYYGPNELGAFVETSSAHEQLEAACELAVWLDEREALNELSAPLLAQLRATLC